MFEKQLSKNVCYCCYYGIFESGGKSVPFLPWTCPVSSSLCMLSFPFFTVGKLGQIGDYKLKCLWNSEREHKGVRMWPYRGIMLSLKRVVAAQVHLILNPLGMRTEHCWVDPKVCLCFPIISSTFFK